MENQITRIGKLSPSDLREVQKAIRGLASASVYLSGVLMDPENRETGPGPAHLASQGLSYGLKYAQEAVQKMESLLQQWGEYKDY